MDKKEYFINKSKELLKEQSDSFISTHSKAAIITAMLSIFVPLFFSAISGANICLKWISLLPLLLMICSVITMLLILKPRDMKTGFSESKLDKLKNEKIDRILELEVSANLTALEINEKTVIKQQKIFKIGLLFAILSIIASTLLLFINLITK